MWFVQLYFSFCIESQNDLISMTTRHRDNCCVCNSPTYFAIQSASITFGISLIIHEGETFTSLVRCLFRSFHSLHLRSALLTEWARITNGQDLGQVYWSSNMLILNMGYTLSIPQSAKHVNFWLSHKIYYKFNKIIYFELWMQEHRKTTQKKNDYF